MSDFSRELLSVFKAEHQEHLERLRELLAPLEKGGSWEAASFEEALRRAHSLKGAARAVDLKVIERLAHRLESVLARAREGALPLDREALRVIREALDSSEGFVLGPAESQAGEPERAIQELDRLLGLSPQAAPPPSQAFKPVESVRLSAERLDGLLRSAGELLAENLCQDRLAGELRRIWGEIGDIAREWERIRRNSPAPLAGSLDSLGARLRELAEKLRGTRRLQQRSSRRLSLLGGRLREDARRARLAPAQSLWEGLSRMVREIAREQGKELEFEASGLEVETDRRVLQALKDPVIHLLRNAATHGIEAPQERKALGKSQAGRVSLRLQARGNRLEVWVEDDGRGIDLKAVAEAAAAKGMALEAGALSSEEALRLLFEPGFSTARSATELSGRGMGLAIVREAVLKLQGSAELCPREAGLRVLLSVPISLATRRLLLVSCRGRSFAFPAHAVEGVRRIKFSEMESLQGGPAVRWEGQALPLLALAELLGLGEGRVETHGQSLSFAVLRAGEKRIALAVDSLLEVREDLVLEAPPFRGGRQGGAILLEDGSPALVLNPVELLEASQAAKSLATEEPSPKAEAPSILVVDDSITTRALERGILQAHGYQVRLAVDGEEALSQLRLERPDLVIADVKMPRMDGFALIEQMKRDQGLSRIPVVLVTSMESRQDKEKGLALGAEAYLVKRKFDQQDLLETVRQLLGGPLGAGARLSSGAAEVIGGRRGGVL